MIHFEAKKNFNNIASYASNENNSLFIIVICCLIVIKIGMKLFFRFFRLDEVDKMVE